MSVIVALYGGLGNQMFQYAAARAVAQRIHAPLYLDLTWFDGEAPRSFMLDQLRVAAAPASSAVLGRVLGGRTWRGRLRRRLDHILPARHRRIIREPDNKFDDRLAVARPPLYLSGFWQDERYFFSVADALHAEFTPIAEPDAHTRELAQQMATCNSVALHVRLGDYRTDPDVVRKHGVLDREYYRVAIEKMADVVATPHVFLFSDEPELAASLLGETAHTVVSADQAAAPVQDLWLMTRCKHHIISNSTFGWWGAWLAGQPEQIVIAPQRWYADGTASSAIIPERWFRL